MPNAPRPCTKPHITQPTARFLLTVLDGLTLNVGAPDFDDAAASVMDARTELKAILEPTITQTPADASPTT